MQDGERTRKENVLNQEKANLEIRRNFYTVRVASKWNSLPEKVKTQQSLNAFKNSLDKWTEDEARRETDLNKNPTVTGNPRNKPRDEERRFKRTIMGFPNNTTKTPPI